MRESCSLADSWAARGTTPAIFHIQNELYQIVKQMLSMLLVAEETNRRVWFAGMNLLLFFASERGSIDKVRLIGLDIRVFVAFAQYIDYISDGVWRNLIRMLCNLLFVPESGATISGTLSRGAGGSSAAASPLDMSVFLNGSISIKFIIDLYMRSRSLEARSNLFVVIYDYLRECYLRRRPASDSDSDDEEEEELHILSQYKRCFDLLVLFEANQFFSQLFTHVTDDFAESVANFLQSRCRDPSASIKLQEAFAKVDYATLRDLVLGDFVRLAQFYNKMDPEHEVALLRGKGASKRLHVSSQFLTAAQIVFTRPRWLF